MNLRVVVIDSQHFVDVDAEPHDKTLCGLEYENNRPWPLDERLSLREKSCETCLRLAFVAQKPYHSEPFPVKELRESGLLWFINNAILWPVGVALAVSVDAEGKEGPAGSYDSHLTLSQWAWPDGHRETIETTWTDEEIAKEPGGKHPWQRLLEWLPTRIPLLPPAERRAALQRLEQWGLYEAGRIEKPRELWTQEGGEYEINWGVSRETPDSPVEVGPVDPGDEQG